MVYENSLGSFKAFNHDGKDWLLEGDGHVESLS